MSVCTSGRNIRHGIACTCVACALVGALNFGDRLAWLPQAHSSDHLPEPNFTYTIVRVSNVTAPNSGAVVSSLFWPLVAR